MHGENVPKFKGRSEGLEFYQIQMVLLCLKCSYVKTTIIANVFELLGLNIL